LQSKTENHNIFNKHSNNNLTHSTIQRGTNKNSEKRYCAGALCVSVKLIFIFLSATRLKCKKFFEGEKVFEKYFYKIFPEVGKRLKLMGERIV